MSCSFFTYSILYPQYLTFSLTFDCHILTLHSSDLTKWKNELVPASPEAVKFAEKFVDKMHADGCRTFFFLPSLLFMHVFRGLTPSPTLSQKSDPSHTHTDITF